MIDDRNKDPMEDITSEDQQKGGEATVTDETVTNEDVDEDMTDQTGNSDSSLTEDEEE